MSEHLLGYTLQNNLSAVKECIETYGVNVNVQDDKGRTALHIACSKGNLPMIEYLLAKGANYNLPDCMNNTPLHVSVITGNSASVELIIQASRNSNEPLNLQAADKSGKTALQWAHSRLNRIRSTFNQYSITDIQDEIQQMIELLSSSFDTSAIKSKASNIHSIQDLDDLQSLLENMSI